MGHGIEWCLKSNRIVMLQKSNREQKRKKKGLYIERLWFMLSAKYSYSHGFVERFTKMWKIFYNAKQSQQHMHVFLMRKEKNRLTEYEQLNCSALFFSFLFSSSSSGEFDSHFSSLLNAQWSKHEGLLFKIFTHFVK